MGRLTTHILDTANGHPGAGIKIQLFRLNKDRTPVTETQSNQDGRCDRPLIADQDFQAGEYELVFHVGDYFADKGQAGDSPRFLDQVVIRFGIANPEEHYHVPLLVSPWSYSTYRGS